MFRALVAIGYGKDARVREGLEHIAEEINAARGIPCIVIDWSVYPTCRMALPKVLLAMTALPESTRSPAMKRAAKRCMELLMAQEVSRYVSPLGRTFYEQLQALPPGTPRSISTKPEKRAAIREARNAYVADHGGLGELEDKAGWLRFGFPLHYNSDTLEAMVALARAGAPKRSPRLRPALDQILARRRPDGRWNLDLSWNGKMIADVEKKGAPSRWITCRALEVLAWFRGLEIVD